MTEPAALLALDWGTTSLRAYRLARDGAVLDVRSAKAGILQVPDRNFSRAFADVAGDWLADARLPVIASGMITSRQGWVETAYVDCPATPAAIAAGLVPHALGAQAGVPGDVTIHFTPGVRMPVGAAIGLGLGDVMRGEETEILGAFGEGEADSGLAVLPGTHSKWARVERGAIAGFATFMTGEIFAALREHTILGRLGEAGAPDTGRPAFLDGVEAGARAAERGIVTHGAFGARTLALAGHLEPADVAPWLSGYLIGAEAEGGKRAGGWLEGEAVRLLGSAALVEAYERALAHLGFQTWRGPPHAAARGLHEIALARGLMS